MHMSKQKSNIIEYVTTKSNIENAYVTKKI